uniref:Nuclear pore glycoprotein p62 n=1 Tax=Leptobrachium leishanense TaxID=445787 RepID=A0A8C5Q3Q9_9ANUR
MSGFNFGSASSGGFSFGMPKTSAPTATSGFSFGTVGTAPSGGFSFGTTTQNPAAVSSGQSTAPFSFSTPASAAGTTSGFSFGTQAISTPASVADGLSFGTSTPKVSVQPTQPVGVIPSVSSTIPTSQPTVGFSFGSSSAIPTSSTGFSFNGGAANNTANAFGQLAAPTGLSFGTPVSTATVPAVTNTQAATTFSLGVPSSGNSLGFGLPAVSFAHPAPTSTPLQTVGSTSGANLNFGDKPYDNTPAAASTAISTVATPSVTSLLGSSGSSLFSPVVSATASVTATTSTGLTLGSTGTGLNFGLKNQTTSVAQASALSTNSSLNVKPLVGVSGVVGQTVSSSTANSSVSTTPVMTYVQLENLINKWSLELEDQEKHFLQQATQVNAWDRTLIHNGERITALHRELETVKLDQKRQDQELDFILSQQKELEDLLIPLEESVKEQSGTIYLQHADEEREKTYKLAENIDAQLKRMAQDLKDVIEHLNTSIGPGDSNNPLQQICKILNAHMDSLQWIDQNSALLQRKVEQVAKECENRRKEQDRGFPITFD